MNTYTRLAAAAVVAVIAVGGALYLIGPRNGVGGPTAAPSPTQVTPVATSAPTTMAAAGADALARHDEVDPIHGQPLRLRTGRPERLADIPRDGGLGGPDLV